MLRALVVTATLVAAVHLTVGSSTAAPTTLPPHFRIEYGDLVSDCRVSGDAVRCTETLTILGAHDTYISTMTGTLSGMTVTGTATLHSTNPDQQSPECISGTDITGPITYSFGSDGTVSVRWGPYQRTFTNSCNSQQPGPNASEDPNLEPVFTWTGTWSAS